MVWSLVLLLCDPTSCSAVSGPVVTSEGDCQQAAIVAVEYVQKTYPDVRIMGVRCLPWGKGA